jgi:lipid-A-disaccharide synthase
MLTVLPGSRRGEIAHHLPVLVPALAEIRRKIQTPLEIVVAVAAELDSIRLEQKFPANLPVHFLQNDTYNALSAADLAIVSSGTATVETALLGKPMIVIYRLSPLTARLAKPLVRTKFFSMVNLIAGRAVVPELIQHDFTPERLAAETSFLLSRTPEAQSRIEEMKRGLQEVQSRLGSPGAVERAADEIVRLLQSSESNAK